MVKLRGAGALLFVLFLDCWQWSNADRSPSSKNLEEGMAKIFDEILLQVFSSITFDESRRTAGKSMTKRATEETASVAGNSPEPASFLSHVDRISNNGHISEERKRKAPSLFNRAVSEPLTTVDQGRVKPDTQSKAVPCTQLPSFLQRDIVIAAISVAGILAATGLLLLMLTIHSRRKRPLYSPANITYNIFIMNGKTWWQKSQEKDSKKFAGKQKQLNCDSCV
ncbi:hypothetical protein mRhiFer1_001863 [Rhinolophus ferrumequinum]|uniref:Uncharacterized protein n=1 Tax=Rhinolophus ferrumequinum TaxID=59479 RepID=A0A7J7R343_RHIFE|nr:hypothetical protein mRhiFer1_001863 [Rhinolophus ferrumequinum]